MRELSLHILDILQNSVEAGATLVELTIEEDSIQDRLTIAVSDNGCGISEERLQQVFDPFHTTRRTRHVGLGLPLLKAAAQRCGGDVTIRSQVGVGTALEATFQRSHIDRAPLGDMTSTLLSFVLGGRCDLHYAHRVCGPKGDRVFELQTADIKAELGDVPLSHRQVREWLREYIVDGETALIDP